MIEKDIKIIRTVCPRNCYSGCGMEVHVKNGKIVKVTGDKLNTATRGKICLKGLSYPQLTYAKDRLLYPLKRVGERGRGEFKRISWEEAVESIYENMTNIASEYGPTSILYYPGSGNHGSVMQLYAYGFWYQLGGYSTIRGNLCDPAGVAAVKYTLGAVKHNALTDIDNSKLIVLWGKNPSFTNVHSMFHIFNAKKHGANLIVIDPRLNESSQRSDLHLMPRCGTDGLLAIGIAKCLIAENAIDRAFIDRYVHGFPEYARYAAGWSLDDILNITEVDTKNFERLIEMIQAAGTFTLIMGKGMQRYSNGGQTTRSIAALAAITGSIGKSGSGFYFGDSQRPRQKWPYYPPKPDDIRSDMTMGRLASDLSELNDPPVKAMWVQGANPMTSNPARNRLEAAMKGLDFIVCAEQFMTDTAKLADVVLPVAMFLEENDLIRSYGHSYIQLKQKILESPGECKTDKEIYRLLAQRYGMDMQYLPEDDDEILEEVIRVSGYNTTLDEMRTKPYLFEEYDDIAFRDMRFHTPSGKIEILSEAIERDWGIDALPKYREPLESKYTDPDLYAKYPLQFMSAHAKERINSQFTQADWVEELTEPVLHINVHDAKARHIKHGDKVRVFNDRGEIFVKAVVGDMVKRGTVNTFEGWYEKTHASVNKLTTDRATDIGYGAAFHNCLVEVEKVRDNGEKTISC